MGQAANELLHLLRLPTCPQFLVDQKTGGNGPRVWGGTYLNYQVTDGAGLLLMRTTLPASHGAAGHTFMV